MDYYLKDLTEESMHEALHDFTEEMFLTVFGQTLEGGDFSFSRYQLFNAVRIVSECGTELNYLYEPGERFNPEYNKDFLDLLNDAIKVATLLKNRFSKNLVNEFTHKDIKSILVDIFDDVSNEDKEKFANSKTIRRIVYVFGTQVLDLVIQFYQYMKAFYMQGFLSVSEICYILKTIQEQPIHPISDSKEDSKDFRLINNVKDDVEVLLEPARKRLLKLDKEYQDYEPTLSELNFNMNRVAPKQALQNVTENLMQLLQRFYVLMDLKA